MMIYFYFLNAFISSPIIWSSDNGPPCLTHLVIGMATAFYWKCFLFKTKHFVYSAELTFLIISMYNQLRETKSTWDWCERKNCLQCKTLLLLFSWFAGEGIDFDQGYVMATAEVWWWALFKTLPLCVFCSNTTNLILSGSKHRKVCTRVFTASIALYKPIEIHDTMMNLLTRCSHRQECDYRTKGFSYNLFLHTSRSTESPFVSSLSREGYKDFFGLSSETFWSRIIRIYG